MLLLLACTPPPAPPPTAAPLPEWDPGAADVVCAPGGAAPLLDAALADADLDRADLGFTDRQWSAWGDLVENPWVLSWFPEVHHNPEAVPCFAGQIQADIDAAAAAEHPVAAMLGAYAPHADVTLFAQPVDRSGADFADALARLADVAGSAADPGEAAAGLDAALADALVPAILAIADAIELRHAMDAEVEEYSGRMPSKLFNQGSGSVIAGGGSIPDLGDTDEYEWFTAWFLSDSGPRALVDAARRIAYALEDAGLPAFEGGSTDWSYATDAGVIRVSPGTDDTHADDGPVLLHIDLGGDDTWTSPAGATRDDENPVSVVVDLGGADRYGYVEAPDANDAAGALVSDADGRQSAGNGMFISDSDIGRQGSGRYGVGMLLDLGDGDDTYASLRMSQGYGSLGVGVLYDADGDDTYAAEAGAQGSGVFGFGILFDGGGSDAYHAWAYAQGFGYVGSGGLLADLGDGDDVYLSDPGNAFGGTTLYYSPQLPGGEGNSSFTQGAGFGMRGDAWGTYLAGGLGTLRDGGGNDRYTGGVFALGTGYWEGTGLLADAGGDDTYDSLYYGQGGAAHYALAILVDGGGDDAHNTLLTPYYMMMGAGHDYSVGVLIDESGDDVYVVPGLALGASNCQGRGVFADNDGSDTYSVSSSYSTGLGNHSGECEARRNEADSTALFLDSGGDADAWTWPDESRAPADDSVFGIAWAGTADEHGGAVDGDGESGFHAAY